MRSCCIAYIAYIAYVAARKRKSFSAFPRNILCWDRRLEVYQPLLGQLQRIGPRGVVMGIVGLDHDVVLTNHIEILQAMDVVDEITPARFMSSIRATGS